MPSDGWREGSAGETSSRFLDLTGDCGGAAAGNGVRLVEYRGYLLIAPGGCCDVGHPDEIRRDPESELTVQRLTPPGGYALGEVAGATFDDPQMPLGV